MARFASSGVRGRPTTRPSEIVKRAMARFVGAVTPLSIDWLSTRASFPGIANETRMSVLRRQADPRRFHKPVVSGSCAWSATTRSDDGAYSLST